MWKPCIVFPQYAFPMNCYKILCHLCVIPFTHLQYTVQGLLSTQNYVTTTTINFRTLSRYNSEMSQPLVVPCYSPHSLLHSCFLSLVPGTGDLCLHTLVYSLTPIRVSEPIWTKGVNFILVREPGYYISRTSLLFNRIWISMFLFCFRYPVNQTFLLPHTSQKIYLFESHSYR